MRRGFLYGSVWLLAMGVAVSVSWWGIRSVMSGPLNDAPRALVIGGSQNPSAPSPEGKSSDPPPVSSPPPSPGGSGQSAPPASGTPQTRPPGPGGNTPPAAPPRTPGGDGKPNPGTTPPPDPPTGKIEPVSVEGGRVVFEMGASSASLVSATPASGWQVKTWHQSTYIRVTFTKASQEISVFCVWHDQAPRIQIEGP